MIFNHYNMRRSKLLAKTVFLFVCYYLLSSVKAEAQPKYKVFDFSKAAPSGQTLYYKKVSGTTDEVYLCPPYSESSYGSYTKPSGNVVVPETVSYGGHTYNVTGMYTNPFKWCKNLTSVTLPEGMSYFNGTALFRGCTSLERINLPSTMTKEISWSTSLDSCWSLTEVNYAAGNSRYKSGNGVVFSRDGDSLILYPSGKNPGNPNFLQNLAGSAASGLKYIGGLGWNCFLEYVNIPNTATTLGGAAFYGCPKLKRVEIGDGVKIVGASVFSRCPQIQEVTFGCSVESIGEYIFFRSGYPNTSLNTIIMKPHTPPSGVGQIINGVQSHPVVIVPCNSMTAYGNTVLGSSSSCTLTNDYLYGYQMSSSSNGSVSITQEPACWNGCVLKATANPYSGKRFKKWIIQYPDGTSDGSRTNANLSLEITSNIIITPTFENAVAIEEVDKKNISVYAYDGKIHFAGLENKTDVCVYSIDGRLVYKDIIQDNSAVLVPSTGVYIVSIDGFGKRKIVVMH